MELVEVGESPTGVFPKSPRPTLLPLGGSISAQRHSRVVCPVSEPPSLKPYSPDRWAQPVLVFKEFTFRLFVCRSDGGSDVFLKVRDD